MKSGTKMPGCWQRWDYWGRSPAWYRDSAWYRVGLDGGVLLLQLVHVDVVPHGVILKFFTDDVEVFFLGRSCFGLSRWRHWCSKRSMRN